MVKNTYVWYVGYGSNLFSERFICYIKGRRFLWGGSLVNGCKDKTLPIENKPVIISHGLFFAKSSSSWNNGGVAFVTTNRDESMHTYRRMWKVTEEQFSEIWDQEGRVWYNEKIDLGRDDEGVPIWTITSKDELNSSKPSDNYLKTIIAGLKETHHLSDKDIMKYMMKMPGIKDNFKEKNLDPLF